jgi:hypothetical protein
MTGEPADSSDPDEMCAALTEWLRENESTVNTLLDDATATFDGVSFDDIESVLEAASNGDRIEEAQLVDAAFDQQAKEYQKAREILQEDPSPWSQLQDRYRTLRAEHPQSLTTESIGDTLDASRPPSLKEVQRLLTMPVIGGDDIWAELQRVAEELRQELPNADVTDEVMGLVDANDRPTDEQATELLDEAEELLARIRAVRDALDDVDDGGIVLIEE